MEKKPTPLPLIVGGLIVLIVGAVAVWYLALPLFVSETVDEPLPFDIPSQEEIAAMSEAEIEQVREQVQAAMPDQEEVAQMSAEAQQALEEAAMEAAAALPDQQMDEAMPAQPVAIVQGQLQGADDFHQGTGTATIYQVPESGHILRFEDFEVTNGPDLHVLLASNPTPTDHDSLGDYIDLGSLKGNIGNQNYEIPSDTDVSQFQSVVIYCQPFSVVFATATLGS